MSAGARGRARRVLVVGDIVTDVVAIVGEPIWHASDTEASIAITGGGAGANTAAWLAAAGAPVTLCGVVGDDDAGGARVRELTSAGVDCAVRREPEATTGAIVVIAERVERTMLADRGANLRLRGDDVDAAFGAFGLPVHLHLSGYALLDADSRPAAAHALRAARSRGLTTSVDAASAGPLRRAPAFLEWVRGADVLFANADEARALVRSGSAGDGYADGGSADGGSAGDGYADGGSADGGSAGDGYADGGSADGGSADAPALAAELAGALSGVLDSALGDAADGVADGVASGVAVVKLGAAGAVAAAMGAAGARLWSAPAAPCAVVDTTGAGDAFAAGFLSAWLASRDVAAGLSAGAALGARAVSAVGARPRI